MSDTNSTRRTDEPPTRDGAPLAGWPTAITAEEAVALRGALKQLQTALDAVVRERDEARARALKLWAVLEMVRDADNDCRVEGWATIPDAARRSIDEALEDAEVERLRAERDEAQSSCAYPDCVDLGPNGKCTKWLTGKCNPVLEAKP
jgi:hypothetical protein